MWHLELDSVKKKPKKVAKKDCIFFQARKQIQETPRTRPKPATTCLVRGGQPAKAHLVREKNRENSSRTRSEMRGLENAKYCICSIKPFKHSVILIRFLYRNITLIAYLIACSIRHVFYIIVMIRDVKNDQFPSIHRSVWCETNDLEWNRCSSQSCSFIR